MAFLEIVGQYSFSIFLWHSLAGAAMRTALGPLALPTAVLFALLLATAILTPILGSQSIRRIPVLLLLFGDCRPRLPRARPMALPIFAPMESKGSVPDVRLHDLRHSAASNMVNGGSPSTSSDRCSAMRRPRPPSATLPVSGDPACGR